MKSLNDTGQRFETWGLMLLFSFGRTSCLEHHIACTSRISVLIFPNRGVWAKQYRNLTQSEISLFEFILLRRYALIWKN